MSNSIAEKIYPHLPIWAQNIACTYYGWRESKIRFSKFFHNKLEWLQGSQFYSASDIEAYQDEQVRKIVKHAYDTVPYYRRTFNERKITPKDIKSVKDLHKLPILTKEDVRHHAEEMLSSDFKKKDLIPVHTSGTTGKSLHFYKEPEAIAFQWAIWARFRNRFGVNYGERCLNITPRPVVPTNQHHPPYWRVNPPFNQLLISSQHLVKDKIEYIVERINFERFNFYIGYPSSIYILTNCMNEASLTIDSPPKYIFTGSENLFEYQRSNISQVIKAPVVDHYGFAEGCGNASQCNKNVYHEDFEFGEIECLNSEAGNKQNTYKGQIVCTGFGSRSMPFIRYDVGDIGIWSNNLCNCGMKSKILISIEGRTGDFVITPEGSKILNFNQVFTDSKNVKESQVVQKELGSIIVRLVRRPGFTNKDEKSLTDKISKWISTDLKVDFEYVNEIERESGGKFRAVKSFLEN